MIGDPWDPGRYGRFRSERRQPFDDLVSLVRPRSRMRIVDLGCGAGELTAELHRGLGARETLGLDNSEAMLERARPLAGGGLRFEKGDIGDFGGDGAFDLVFSNAALHWVRDHASLLQRLGGALAPGGQLAVQVPSNRTQTFQTVALDVAQESPFRETLAGHERQDPVLEPLEYARLLDGLGFREQRVRLQVYPHSLPSRDDVVEWVRGTTLTHYERLLPGELYRDFAERYRLRLLDLLADAHPFFFPFQRILFWARL